MNKNKLKISKEKLLNDKYKIVKTKNTKKKIIVKSKVSIYIKNKQKYI